MPTANSYSPKIHSRNAAVTSSGRSIVDICPQSSITTNRLPAILEAISSW